MTLIIEVEFECTGEREAAALEAALRPDNHPLPKEQRISTSRKSNALGFSISSTRPSSCVSSALSLISDAKLFAEVWSLAS